MTDEDFRKLANTFGFAPSRALRELLDIAVSQARMDERIKCAAIAEEVEPYRAADLIRKRQGAS
jgi:hypothetical protein